MSTVYGQKGGKVRSKMMKRNSSPGTCNTGAQNTLQQPLIAVVDWLQGTFKNAKNWREFVQNILQLDDADFTEIGKGMFGWSGQVAYGSIRILYGNQVGVHLIMSGQACRQYEQKRSFQELLSRFINGGKLSRLDLAIDDMKGYFTIEKVVNYLKRGKVRSLFKTAKVIEKLEIETGESKGKTVYFGSEQSMILVRMYEKNKERIAKGYDVQDIDHWNRIEIQTRDERANEVAKYILENDIGKIASSVLKRYIKFCKSSRDKNKSRWEIADWWKKFLGETENLRLTKNKVENDLIKKDVWIEKQIARSIAQLWLANDGQLERIIEIIEQGAEKLSLSDLNKIDEMKNKYKEYLKYKEREKIFNINIS